MIMSRFIAVQRLSSAWKATGKGIKLTIPHDCVEFQQYYDSLQEKISKLSVIDELMAGMLYNVHIMNNTKVQ